MTIYLRQSTASQEVPLGYFLDSTDGDTAETGLTIANTDIKLWKTGATSLANKNSGGAAHMAGGVYYATLDATDSNTIGPMVIFAHVSGALAVRVDCVVLDEAVYDVLFGTTAPSTYAGGDTSGTTTLLSRVVGTIASGTHNAQSGDSYARLGAPAGASVSADVAAVKAQTAAIETDTQDLQTQVGTDGAGLTAIGDTRLANLDATVSSRSTYAGGDTSGTTTLLSRVIGTLATGTHNPQSGDAYARLGAPAGASVSADVAAVKAQTAAIETDTQDLQTQVGTDGAGLTAIGDTRLANLDATVSSRLATAGYTAPLDASGIRTSVGLATANLDTQLAALPTDADVQTAATAALNAYDPPTKAELDSGLAGLNDPTAAAVADAVWDEAIAGHAGVGSTGEALAAAGSAGDPWATALPGAYGSGTAGKIIGDNINATVSSRSTFDVSNDDVSLSVLTINAVKAGLSTLTEADIRTATGLASANLDTQLAALPTDADVQTAATAALTAYDPPTKAEMDNGLAALNDLDATAVQAAAAAALAAYDPPTKAELDSAVSPLATAAALDAVDNYVDTEVAAIKAVTDKLDTTLVQDGAVYDFTAAALAAAPSSSGGDATAANQTAILAALADVPTDVDTELTASHGAGVWGAAGSGLLTDTITVNDGTDPLDGVLVQVATDSNFSNIIRSGYTNGLGQVTFHYDAAGTYYGRAEIATFNVLTFEITVS